MSLLVLEPGIDTRIVDLGRPRTRSLGVPVGGAADRRSLILGNSLIGNPPDAPALEITLKGPRLRANVDVGCVLFGAPFEVNCDGLPIETCRTFVIRAGQELHIGGTRRGMRAYLCVRGGFQLPTILHSRSGLDPLQRGNILPCESSAIPARFCPALVRAFAYLDALLRVWPDDVWLLGVLPGLQAPWFDETEFLDRNFTVTPATNRMGLRLRGGSLTMTKRELVSEAVCPGAIQVTPDGQCIILGVDGQTIGGYPKIAHVVQSDLDVLGQLRPGDRIRFTKVSLEDAIQWERQAQARMREWSLRLRVSLDAFPGEWPQ